MFGFVSVEKKILNAFVEDYLLLWMTTADLAVVSAYEI